MSLWNERKIQWDFRICPPFKNNIICLLQYFFQDLVWYNFDYCILSHKFCQRTLFFHISSLILFPPIWKIFSFLPAKPAFYCKLWCQDIIEGICCFCLSRCISYSANSSLILWRIFSHHSRLWNIVGLTLNCRLQQRPYNPSQTS